MDVQSWSVTPWRADGSHQASVGGVVLQGGAPLASAVVEVAGHRSEPVGPKGTFNVSVDRSFPHTIDVRVVSPPGTGAQARVTVCYPIRILHVHENGADHGQVVVDALIVTDSKVAFLRNEDWAVEGTVRGADGKPVAGAVVALTEYARSGTPGAHVELYSGSAPTDSNGRYRLFTVPESDTDVTLRVTAGNQTYTLPPNRVFNLPEETSSRIDIRLPAGGTVITDRPPTLVSQIVPGARWRVLVAGATAAGDPEEFESTVPDTKGRFQVRMDKAAWLAGPVWFEQTYLVFQDADLEPGDRVSGKTAGALAAGTRVVVPPEAVRGP
jgi:hypothetical protein